jgi:excinuclease ABC subunit B
VNAKVLLYADTVTPAMQRALEETERRRALQVKFNTEHNITPQTIVKAIRQGIEAEVKARQTVASAIKASEQSIDQTEIITLLEEEMLEAARNLEFERAAQLRDKINEMKGAPVIKSGNAFPVTEEEAKQNKIWQPKTPRRGGRGVAK